MKLPKLKFDKATLQDFFLHHVEKIVLGVVAIVLVLFVYWGTKLERMKDDFNAPNQLVKLSDDAKTKMNDPLSWPAIAPQRKPDVNVPEGVAKNTRDVVTSAYPSPDLNRQEFNPLRHRLDPQPFPPKNLTVYSIHGPLAVKRKGTVAGAEGPPGVPGGTGIATDPLSDTVPLNAGIGGVGYPPPGAYGEERGQLPTRETEAERRRKELERKNEEKKKAAAAKRTGPGKAPSGGYDDFMIERGPVGPGVTSNTTPSDAARRFERDRGFVPSSDCTWEMGRAVVVQAVVPWQKEFDEYRRCLEEATDFRIDRDLPNYISYFVERADVTANPEADPKTLKWENPYNAKSPIQVITIARSESWNRWAGFPGELMDSEFMDVELTHPAPPFLLRDLTGAMKHPDVPMMEDAFVSAQDLPRGTMINEFGEEVEAPEGVLPNGPGGMRNDGMQRTRTQFQHKMPTVTSHGGEGRQSIQGGQGQQTMDQLEQQIRQYKLLRFTDASVLPGHVYRYRMKVVLEDPNHPKDLAKDPSAATMEDRVKLRLKQVADKEGGKSRIFWIESDWSEPSPTVKLPETDAYLASHVEEGSKQTVRADRPAMPLKPTTGKMVAVTWDAKHAVDVPVVVDVERGSAVNFEGETQVIHPVDGSTRKMKDYSLRKPSVVADIAGGVSIQANSVQAVADKKSLVTPGEILVFDEHGNWHMLNEAKDMDEIERQILDPTLLKDKEEPPPVRPGATTTPPPGRPPGLPNRE